MEGQRGYPNPNPDTNPDPNPNRSPNPNTSLTPNPCPFFLCGTKLSPHPSLTGAEPTAFEDERDGHLTLTLTLPLTITLTLTLTLTLILTLTLTLTLALTQGFQGSSRWTSKNSQESSSKGCCPDPKSWSSPNVSLTLIMSLILAHPCLLS